MAQGEPPFAINGTAALVCGILIIALQEIFRYLALLWLVVDIS